jgi:hypothetical protein
MKKAKPQDVDACIDAAPKETWRKLKELRAVIKTAAPGQLRRWEDSD